MTDDDESLSPHERRLRTRQRDRALAEQRQQEMREAEAAQAAALAEWNRRSTPRGSRRDFDPFNPYAHLPPERRP